MRGRRWLLIGNLGLGSCLLAGCLRAALPPASGERRPPVSHSQQGADASRSPAFATNSSLPPSDYLVSRTPTVQPEVLPAAAAEKPVEPVELRVPPEKPAPAPPASPPPKVEIHPVPLTRPDAPCVQLLRSLLEHHPEEEIHEQLKPYDPLTKEAMLLLLTSIAQLEQGGGLTRISPRELGAWTDRLNTLTASLRGRSQLVLERMCFCSSIHNFGDFAPLPPEHTFFQPGEEVRIYVQVRHFSNRRQGDKYVTVLKGRLEIYDENNRDKPPPIIWASQPCEDVSAAPRQDYYINFHFRLPRNCPAGLYTVRITVEDWTDAPPGAKKVPSRRIARRTLDFRVGGPIAHK